MPTIFDIKEQEVLQTPVLLFDCTMRNGQHEYWATHPLTFAGNLYLPTLIEHGDFEMRSQTEDGVDGAAKVSLTLSNLDSRYSQLERSVGWKGASLTVRFAFFNLQTGLAETAAEVIFRGVANAPDSIREGVIRLSFDNRLNFQRVVLPEIRIQKRCPWLFPANQSQRLEAIDGGDKGAYSPFFRCGYSAGEAGGAGNLNGAEPFISCDYTRTSCEQRGMFRTDGGNTITRRFGGVEFVPSSVLVRGFGEKSLQLSAPNSNEAKYNDVVPLVYGTGWLEPPVSLARNDGNLTRMEVLLCAGEIQGVEKVVVNDIEIPVGETGRDMTGTGWYNVVSLGNRTGDFNLDFSDSAGQPLGDPYGSMAYLSVVVPNRIHNGRSLPRVQVLIHGMKLPVYDATEAWTGNFFTNNPAWVLLDVLRRSGWELAELDVKSFADAALYCADTIQTVDLHGNPVSTARMQCNLILRKRRSASEVLRGIRNCSGLLLSFGDEGKLQCRVESTFAVQHPVKPAGTNAETALFGGWPVYEFGDGTTSARGILRNESGEPTIRFFSRSSANTPNRFSVEFQDAFNEFQQDSVSLVDAEDIAAGGRETSVSLAALGLPNFDQALRMAKLQLLKSVRGNMYVELETSVRAFGIRPGDLITVTYAKEGLLRQPFRVIRVAPGLNQSTMRIAAQIHDESWYVLSAGEGAAGSGRQPRFEQGLPRPLGGVELDGDGMPRFGVSESWEQATDGTALSRLHVRSSPPPRVRAGRSGIPLLGLSALSQASGGTLAGGQTLYYAVTGLDADGGESPLSFIARAFIPSGSSTNTVTLQSLSFAPGTAGFNVYRGPSPQQLRRIASSQALATSFLDSGLAEGFGGPPDENYSHANFHWRWELQGKFAATINGGSIIGNTTLNMLANEYNGQLVRIISGRGAGQERLVESHSATTLVLTRPWTVAPDSSSQFVIAEPTWTPAASSTTDEVTFAIPNREGQTLQLSGRSVNASGIECPGELSLLTRWQILGAAGQALDVDVPPQPSFGISTKGDGSLGFGAVAFPTLNNTRGVTAGTLQLLYWNELQSPTPHALASAVGISDTTVTLTVPGAAAGGYIQVGEEILSVTGVAAGGVVLSVDRGSHGSVAVAHQDGEPVYILSQVTEIVPFSREFFGSPASGSFQHTVYLPQVRVAAAEFFVTNYRGDSEIRRGNFTATTDYGLRTLGGGQISLQVEGFLSIEDDATPPLVVESTRAIRDVYAVVGEAPTEFPVQIRLRQNAATICTLTISVNSTTSNVVNGFNLPPLVAGSLLHLDIVSLGQTAISTPGSDLNVIIRL
jgi:hypothetical protein